MKTKEQLIQILKDIKSRINRNSNSMSSYEIGVMVGKHTVYLDILQIQYIISIDEFNEIKL